MSLTYNYEASQVSSGAGMRFRPMPIADNSVGDIHQKCSSNYIDSTEFGSNAEPAMNLRGDILPRVSAELSCAVPETCISDIRSFDDLMQNPISFETKIFDNPGDSSANKTVERDTIADCLRLPESMPVSAGEILARTRTGKKAAAAEGPNCKCEKSQCLKMYCGCLSRERYCDECCECKNCHNTKEHEAEVSDVIARAKISNRHALNPDRTRRSGCNCDKSKCIKRYCECYKSQDGCSPQCRCKNCKNLFGRNNIEIIGGDSQPKQKVRKLEASTEHRVVSNAAPFYEEQIPLLSHASDQSLLRKNGANESSSNSSTSIPSPQNSVAVGEEISILPTKFEL